MMTCIVRACGVDSVLVRDDLPELKEDRIRSIGPYSSELEETNLDSPVQCLRVAVN